MPSCTQETANHKIGFGRLGGRVVESQFDGGSMTSDVGVMLLGASDRKLGLMQAAASCIADPRSPLVITHSVADLLGQRVHGLALGWENLNDHGALRCDVAQANGSRGRPGGGQRPHAPTHPHMPDMHPSGQRLTPYELARIFFGCLSVLLARQYRNNPKRHQLLDTFFAKWPIEISNAAKSGLEWAMNSPNQLKLAGHYREVIRYLDAFLLAK